MIRVNGVVQIGSIDINDMWIDGKQDCCTEYKHYMRLERKYIRKLYEDLRQVALDIKGKDGFKGGPDQIEGRIDYLVQTIQSNFSVKDLKELMVGKHSLVEFIIKANAIRKRNIEQSPQGIRLSSKNKRQNKAK
tara:strand:+ start:717 stop:1118 length:402 start_codon:yes stop_codon:yes gene_type:complete